MKTQLMPRNPLDGSYLTGSLALVGCGLLIVGIACLAPLLRPLEILRAIRTACRATAPDLLP